MIDEANNAVDLDRLKQVREAYGRDGLVYGCGTGLRGKSYASPEDRTAGIAIRTRWILFLYVPLIPIGSYRIAGMKDRVAASGRLITLIGIEGRVPLAWGQIVRVWAVSLTIAAVLYLLLGWWSGML